MKMKDIEAFEELRIGEFLKDPDCRQVVIPYKGKRLNAACDWWKLQGSLVMLLRAFLNEILRKVPPCSLKNKFYRLMGVKIGKDVLIGPDVSLDPLFPKLITIEDSAVLGWGCQIAAHEFLNEELRLGRVSVGKRTIIGAQSLIRAGVKIGDEAVVSMKSFVNKDVPDGEAVGGVPARKIKVKKRY
jgi:acetyltransferase-like isoleucine patch superfamily enzyme